MNPNRYRDFLESVVHSLIMERRKDGKNDLDDIPCYDNKGRDITRTTVAPLRCRRMRSSTVFSRLTLVPYNVLELMRQEQATRTKEDEKR